jgi:hypothetical protein
MKPARIAPDYPAFLTQVKGRIQSARLSGERAVNEDKPAVCAETLVLAAHLEFHATKRGFYGAIGGFAP